MMPSQESTMKSMSPAAAQAALRESLVLDVRTPGEFASVHIEGAILHPLDSLNPNAVQQLASGKKHCLIVCQSGKRATMAANQLNAAGISDVCVLEGGMNAWISAGLAVLRGKGVISLERQVRIAAGILVLSGVLLSQFVHPHWILLSGFVGAGLLFAGITDTCGMGILLARMPWNQKP